jgi:hypothetical protein
VRASAEGKAAARRKAKKAKQSAEGAAAVAAQGAALLDCTSAQALALLVASLPTVEAALVLTEVARRFSGDETAGPAGAVLGLLPSGSAAALLAAAAPAARARLLGAFHSAAPRQAAFRRLSLESQADAVAAMASPSQRASALAMAEDVAELEGAVDKAIKRTGEGKRAGSPSSEGAGAGASQEQAELAKLVGKGKALTPAETQRVQALMQKQGKGAGGQNVAAPAALPAPAATALTEASTTAAAAGALAEEQASLEALAPFLAACSLTHFLKPLVDAGHATLPQLANLSDAQLVACGFKKGHALKLHRALDAWRAGVAEEDAEAAAESASAPTESAVMETIAAPAMFLGCIPCL